MSGAMRELLVVCLLAVIAAGVDLERYKVAQAACNTYGYRVVEADFGKETHLLCLKLEPIGSLPFARSHSSLILDPDLEEKDSHQFPLKDITMAYGFPAEDPSSGTAEGYIGEDFNFYGVLHLDNRTLHADPHGLDRQNKYFGAFEYDNMAAPRPRRNDAQIFSASHSAGYFPYRIIEPPRVPGIARARICDLLLLADKAFFDMDANSSLNHVVRRMMHAVAQADIIFRNADFNEDGIPDNIGFAVKYILVLTSNETNTRVFGDLLKNKEIDGRAYLMRFARLRRLSEVCLGVAFSGHAFHNRTLGLSFTSLGGGLGGAAGGLCDRRAYGRSFNTLAIAHATTEDKGRVPERIAALTLAHEMGHSFGAHHDDNYPDPECHGFLMGSQSSTADSGANFEFSMCSKRLIASTLSSMSYCLVEEDRPYCGNGIVEKGEACDCGLPSRCVHKDPCCTPRGGGASVFEEGTRHKEGCSVAPSAMCHPSQGLCCTAKCQLADFTESGINCMDQDNECSRDDSSPETRCGHTGRCWSDASCHATECVLLGLKECQCVKKGITNENNEIVNTNDTLPETMCRICCKVKTHRGRECVGVERLVRERIVMEQPLPNDWLDPAYRGPNVTLRICKHDSCYETRMRAWPVGGSCVSRNRVGVCSPRGLCKMDYVVPRSNVYPDIMNAQLVGGNKSLHFKHASIILLPYIVLCLIK